MEQPTQEQIKEFWKWCGAPVGRGLDERLVYLSIDLNNLFKYAVPKLVEANPQVEITIYKSHPNCEFEWGCYINDFRDFRTGNTPALALFWALWQVKEIKDG